MDRLGCLRLFVIAVAAGEIAVMIALFDLALAEIAPSAPRTPLGVVKVVALIFGCLAVPTAAAAYAYLANSARSVWRALLALVALPIILASLLALR